MGSGGEKRFGKKIWNCTDRDMTSVENYSNHQAYKTLSGEFGSHQCLVKTEVLCYQQ